VRIKVFSKQAPLQDKVEGDLFFGNFPLQQGCQPTRSTDKRFLFIFPCARYHEKKKKKKKRGDAKIVSIPRFKTPCSWWSKSCTLVTMPPDTLGIYFFPSALHAKTTTNAPKCFTCHTDAPKHFTCQNHHRCVQVLYMPKPHQCAREQ
jgi:hypothetical protein